MFDIEFYMDVYHVVKEIKEGKKIDREYLLSLFEEKRNKNPIVYNIETTNACNMKCSMCPRTTRMTRKVENLKEESFKKVVEQISPHREGTWNRWKEFCKKEYGVKENEMSENNFFLYIIPNVTQLHAYGDPLLDKNIDKHVKYLNDKGIKTYFSCNPINIDINKLENCFRSGLSYIKFSIESVNDEEHKNIRGKCSDFSLSYEKICKLLEIKKEKNYNTVVVITMLDLNRKDQKEDYKKLKEYFKDKDVYIYLKSEDTQWYRKEYHQNKSIHWNEFCKHPWMSMSIKSNGDVAMCMEDYNNEIVLGNVENDSLYDIWNGEKYKQFRLDHLDLNNNIRCYKECDMKMIGSYI